MVAKDKVNIEDEKIKNNLGEIFEDLENNDDVINYYTNASI